MGSRVGALHSQAAGTGNPVGLIDLLRGAGLASPISTVASGFKRAVKPEILVPGGRRYYRLRPEAGGTSAVFEIASAVGQPGQLVAACHLTGGSNQHATRTCGSSNAAALTTRRAAFLIDRIRELRGEPGGESVSDLRTAVIVKAMLVHGASWGDLPSLFEEVFDDLDTGVERWRRIRRNCAQFVGYGPSDFDRGTVCSDQRVILLGSGEIGDGDGHIFSVPLPPALHAVTVLRRLTITLAWLSPINPRNRGYRVAQLWFDPPRRQFNVRRSDAEHDTVRRGTVQHEVLEGDEAISIVDGDILPVQVNCRPDAATKITGAIPYALLVSLETAEPLGVSIYDQIRAKIEAVHAPVPVRAVGREG